MSRLVRRAFVVAALMLAVAAPALAHGFTSVVYADLSSPSAGTVRVDLQLEYDLLVVSAASVDSTDPSFTKRTPASSVTEPAEQERILRAHAADVEAYVAERFRLTAGDQACTGTITDDISAIEKDAAPYADIVFLYACPPTAAGHTVTSALFPDAEGYVTGTTTILTYDLDRAEGSAALTAEHTSFSTGQSPLERFGQFFALGAEHLLTGIDHILFLLALIVGSRSLREVVIAATTFTLVHSLTFILAATGVVAAPPALVEPTIALSIAVVGAAYLWRLRRPALLTAPTPNRRQPFGLDRSGWARVAVVFVFGLVHGLGFASALGIDEPWSWLLLGSLLVFNVGIETVQLGIIVLVFPLLALLRRRAPRTAVAVSATLAAIVTVAGLVWFVQRLTG